eukprot:364615-Chlamydomonas_euryale.AAC.55
MEDGDHGGDPRHILIQSKCNPHPRTADGGAAGGLESVGYGCTHDHAVGWGMGARMTGQSGGEWVHA